MSETPGPEELAQVDFQPPSREWMYTPVDFRPGTWSYPGRRILLTGEPVPGVHNDIIRQLSRKPYVLGGINGFLQFLQGKNGLNLRVFSQQIDKRYVRTPPAG